MMLNQSEGKSMYTKYAVGKWLMEGALSGTNAGSGINSKWWWRPHLLRALIYPSERPPATCHMTFNSDFDNTLRLCGKVVCSKDSPT